MQFKKDEPVILIKRRHTREKGPDGSYVEMQPIELRATFLSQEGRRAVLWARTPIGMARVNVDLCNIRKVT